MKREKGNILIGVCGGIASYKICQLVRLFIKNSYSVKVMMTPAATEFIRPLVFKELTGQQVYLEMFSLDNQDAQHISLSEWGDLVITAPLSANTLSKVACGICDNLLTSVICSVNSQKPVLFVPAMNEGMWRNPLIQDNLFRLKEIKNYTVLSPEKGELACKSVGIGRMPEPGKIYKNAEAILKKPKG